MTLKAVRIIHNILTRIDFSFLAEFFRFAGIYVVECIDGDNDESPYQKSENCFDITIDTCESLQVFKFGSALDFQEIKNKINNIENIREWTQKQQVCALEAVLGQTAFLLGEMSPGSVWDILIQEYVLNDLMLHSLNLQYYFKKSSYVIENTQSVFYSVQHKLESDLETLNNFGMECQYLEYAKIYSRVKVNAGCKFMDQRFEFPIEELAAECTECINKYPEFSNLKVLLGLCYEYEPVYAPMAIRALARALEDEDEYCYSSHIYYWIGKQYEAYHANWADSVNNYKLSYIRQHKYKNMYKLAIAHRAAGKYEKAINTFSGIIYKLQEKINLNMLDPLEIEYYFKSMTMISVIYFNDLKDYLGAIEQAEDLIRNIDQIIDGNRFYTQLYGKEKENYKRLTRQRLETKRIRSILYYSYHYLGLEEKAVRYMNMKDYAG